MLPRLSSRAEPDRLRLHRGERLTSVERTVMIAFLAIVAGLDVVNAITAPSGSALVATLLGVTATLVFVFYLWWPAVATAALGLVFAVSFGAGEETTVLFAAALAAVMVLRLGGTALVLSYGAGFLVATAVVALVDRGGSVNVGTYLVVAAVAGTTGYALRLASARRGRLERQLAESAEQEHQAVLAERRWIAGELHDSIAHHLTVVSLHVQMLDDPAVRETSQDAIRTAARKAMTDLRFVIDLADDAPRATATHAGDLAGAVNEATTEIEAAGHPVQATGAFTDERIPRIAEIVLARVVRESTTNILKYAGDGEVVIRFEIDDEAIVLTMLSPLPCDPRRDSRRDLSSSGTGLSRMAERVIGANGEFRSGAEGEHWRVTARLPLS